MSRRRTLGVITMALVLLAGCAHRDADSRTESTSVPAPTLAARFTTLQLQRAGGFAGLSDQVTVTPEGGWTATAKNGSQRTGRLTADQLARLLQHASDARLGREALRAQKPTTCADAFSYVVTVDAVSVAYVDCPADGELPEVTQAIVRLLGEAGAI